MADRPPQPSRRGCRTCRYCGAPASNLWTDTCREHSDLPLLEPGETLTRNAGYEALESPRHRSNPRKEKHYGR